MVIVQDQSRTHIQAPYFLPKPFTQPQRQAGIHVNCHENHEQTDVCHVYAFHDFKKAFATYNARMLSPTQFL